MKFELSMGRTFPIARSVKELPSPFEQIKWG